MPAQIQAVRHTLRDQISQLFTWKTISGIKTGRQSKMLEKKPTRAKIFIIDGRTDKWTKGLLYGQGDGWTKGRIFHS